MGTSHLNNPDRGYIANILTIPPLIYPFQYNPAQISDTKELSWDRRTSTSDFGDIGAVFSSTKDGLARKFSNADLHRFRKEGDRKISFKFLIDGHEKRPGEPERRREDGNILPDLAILRSFTYPKIVDVIELLGNLLGDEPFSSVWFNSPPTMTLIMGETSVEGFVTSLKITQQQFNKNLDPVRAEIQVEMIENIASIAFIVDSVKRHGRTFYHTAWEDYGNAIL